MKKTKGSTDAPSECVMCKSSKDDPVDLGSKLTYESTTAHYFCLVSSFRARSVHCMHSNGPCLQLLSSNLVQNGEDEEGIMGFLLSDIDAEAARANKLVNSSLICSVKMCEYPFSSDRYAPIAANGARASDAAINRAERHSTYRVL